MLKTMFMCALGLLLGALMVLAVGGARDTAGARSIRDDAVRRAPLPDRLLVPTEPSLLAQEPKPFPGEPQAAPPSANPLVKIVVIDEKHDGKTVSVKKGESVAIKLESNPTTGFNWRVGTVSSSAAKQNGKVEFEQTPLPSGSGPILGRGGHSVIKFDTVAPGKVSIQLEYSRPWEKNKAPFKTFTVTLDIK